MPSADADSLFAAKIEFQRATILGREGQLDEALAAYNRALPIFESARDTYSISCTLGNRAMFRIERGEARAARADLIVSRDGFRSDRARGIRGVHGARPGQGCWPHG